MNSRVLICINAGNIQLMDQAEEGQRIQQPYCIRGLTGQHVTLETTDRLLRDFPLHFQLDSHWNRTTNNSAWH